MLQGELRPFAVRAACRSPRSSSDRLPATLELSLAAIFFSTVIGCVLGTYSALKRGSAGDSALTVVGMLGVSIPEFFFGLVALLIFALHLGWLPVGGRLMPGYETLWDRLPISCCRPRCCR